MAPRLAHCWQGPGCAPHGGAYLSGMIPAPQDGTARRHFRRTLVRVLIVQAVTLLLLWLLQARYYSG
jgi:hypothetical protein